MINNMFPVVFSPFFEHSTIAENVCGYKDKVTGAGFVVFTGDCQLTCIGESTSLGGLGPAKTDAAIIAKLFCVPSKK
jgi:hypothetical protein